MNGSLLCIEYLGIQNSCQFRNSNTVLSLYQPLYLTAGGTSNIKQDARFFHLGSAMLSYLALMRTYGYAFINVTFMLIFHYDGNAEYKKRDKRIRCLKYMIIETLRQGA